MDANLYEEQTLHMFNCSGTRLLFSGQQHLTTRQAFCLEPCCSACLRFLDANLYEEQSLHMCNCSGTRLLFLLSSTRQEGKRFALNPAAVLA